ncbi:MAG: LacI family DNA-binding transcriptional regulator, partial [Atribacterota bacterium]
MIPKEPLSQKRPSSQDVARVAGVSRASVSAYLNGSRFVSAELQYRIERAIKELNYVPDQLARALKMNDAKTIGLVIPIVSNFYNPMIRAVNECAHQKSFSFLLASSEEEPIREKEILQVFFAKRISGILVVPCSYQNKQFLEQINKSGIPIVQVNRKIEGLNIDSVVS